MHVTRVMQEILQLVKYQLQLEYDEDSLSYQRFVTHLKFFAQRMLTRTVVEDDDVSLHTAGKRQLRESVEMRRENRPAPEQKLSA